MGSPLKLGTGATLGRLESGYATDGGCYGRRHYGPRYVRDDGGPSRCECGIAKYSLRAAKGGALSFSVTLSEKNEGASGGGTIACGILGFVLFRWTPPTGSGILAFVVLFAVLIIMAIALSSRKRGGLQTECTRWSLTREYAKARSNRKLLDWKES